MPMPPSTGSADPARQRRADTVRRLAFGGGRRFAVSTLWRDPFGAADAADDDATALAGFVERPHPQVRRYDYSLLGGDGGHLQVRLDEDLVVGLVNAVLGESGRQLYVADEPMLMLRASLSAGCAYTVPGLPSMVFNRPEVVVAYVPQGAEIQVDIYSGVRQHSVVMLMNAERFLPCFGLRADDLPLVLRGVFDGSAPVGRLVTLPLDEKLGRLVESMTQRLRNPALHRLAVAGGLRELVARLLDNAERNPAFAGPGALRPKELDLAYAARDILDEQAAAPPRFADLAHRIGTNQKTLKVVFRRVFGTTMADYCVQRRMRLAQRLLLEGRLSIGQVAGRVGYEHQSSFSAAFSAHAGMAPREYQRQRAALDLPLESPPPRRKPDPGRRA